MIDEERIKLVASKAEEAFWAAVATEFPEAKTGDLGPWTSLKLTNLMERAIREWIDENVGESVA